MPEMLDLSDPKLAALSALIRDSFRVRPNHDPVYVDLAGNLARVGARQHQVVFGRRGSGKSCLLVHFTRNEAEALGVLPVYIEGDELKKLGYPDVLIRLLLALTSQIPGSRRGAIKKLLRFAPTALERQENELRELLDAAERRDVTEGNREAFESRTELSGARGGAKGGHARNRQNSHERTATFREDKLDTLERHLPDYKAVLSTAFAATKCKQAAVIVDDFYLFQPRYQADIIDYLHRLLRGTDMYLKVGTVRHRTTLMRHDGHTIGVELNQDVEEIDLDRTFEDVDSTQSFLTGMLASMCERVGIDSPAEFVSEDGLQALTLASGGVPRDYLNILVDAIENARTQGHQRVTPRNVYKSASRNAYRTKLKVLRDDAVDDAPRIERVFQDVVAFCLQEERKTAFLIDQSETTDHETEHELIQQLMDFKLVHVIEPDTSAASGRTGRFEAYTLDFSLFMEPRRRGIQHVEFWRTDAGRRRQGVREAPTYRLDRARSVLESTDQLPVTESLLDLLADEESPADESASS